MTKVHGVTSQKILVFTVTAMRTLNLTSSMLFQSPTKHGHLSSRSVSLCKTGADIYSVRFFSSGPAVNKLFLKKVFRETEAHALSLAEDMSTIHFT